MKANTTVIAMSIALGVLLGVPHMSSAAEPAPDDILSKLVNNPAPGSLQVYGAGTPPKPKKDSTVQGGKALRVSVTANPSQPWATGLSSTIERDVKAGDTIILAFWARVAEPEGGTATIPAAIQLAAAPYTQVFGEAVTVGPEWKLHQIKGKADRAYKAKELSSSLHLATGTHVIDFGPMFILNMGGGQP